MSELKKGQIVAAWSSNYSSRHIRIFVEVGTSSFGDTVFLCRDAGEDEKYAISWPHCLPLEEVEPGAFIDWERRAGEQTAEAVAMEVELVQRLRRQIRRLCRQIMTNALHRKQSDFCPPLDMPTGPDGRCQRSCIACWEQASFKAVEEGGDDAG